MYSTQTAVMSTGNSSFMPAGINENVTLKEVNVNTSPTGKNFLEIIYEDKDGKTATYDEWKNEKTMWIKTDAELQQRDNQQFGRILQVVKCFYDEIPQAEFNTFIDMINWVKSLLDGKITEKKLLRLKTTYDKKGFVRVSKNGIYVEPMDVAETQIVITGRDILVRPDIPVDKEQPTQDPLSAMSTTPETESENSDNDLPF